MEDEELRLKYEAALLERERLAKKYGSPAIPDEKNLKYEAALLERERLAALWLKENMLAFPYKYMDEKKLKY